jgi:hypothetical protein
MSISASMFASNVSAVTSSFGEVPGVKASEGYLTIRRRQWPLLIDGVTVDLGQGPRLFGRRYVAPKPFLVAGD